MITIPLLQAFEISTLPTQCRLQNVQQHLNRMRKLIIKATKRKLEISYFQRYYIQSVLKQKHAILAGSPWFDIPNQKNSSLM